MENRISDKTIEDISVMAKLMLTEQEKAEAKKDMEKMLACIDKLNEIDTEGIEPAAHISPLENVFREDVVQAFWGSRDMILKNAPEERNGSFVVPKTIEQKEAEDEAYGIDSSRAGRKNQGW